MRGYRFGSCSGIHVVFGFLGCEISCDIGDIGVAAEFGASITLLYLYHSLTVDISFNTYINLSSRLDSYTFSFSLSPSHPK